MSEELSPAELSRLKKLRDQAQETHKTAGDASAKVYAMGEVQPAEEWRFRNALRANADELLELAEKGLDLSEMALALKTLVKAPVEKGSRAYSGALGNANMVLRAYEFKRQGRGRALEEGRGQEIETAI
jgi:hypothetical protein